MHPARLFFVRPPSKLGPLARLVNGPTKRVVDNIKAEGKDRFHWDRDLPGFGVRVRASGRKFFVAQFRAGGRVRRMTLGPVAAMTPEIAHTRAMALLAEAKAGSDPAMQRDANRKAATVNLLGQRFLEEYVPDHCKESTANEYRRSVELFADPGIGRRSRSPTAPACGYRRPSA